MREPRIVLDNLRRKAKDNPEYKFESLYRNLYNVEFFLMAYGKIAPNPGNLTAGADGKTIDGFSTDCILKLIAMLKDESYQPVPVRREYIPKNNGGKRPLGIPATYDKIIQEVIRSILEHIYEDSFSDLSHGFRPERSCHTALIQIKQKSQGTKWWVEGDIKGFFDNINHDVLIGILRKRINDEKFLRLIRKYLRAGYLEDWKFKNSYSGAPQGGIMSPILSNIYLNELDSFMESLANRFNKGTRRKDNPPYKALSFQIQKLRRELYDDSNKPSEKDIIHKHIKELEEKRSALPASDPFDPEYRRVSYTRYADDCAPRMRGA